MPANDVLVQGENKMNKAITDLKKELVNIRTGRANPLVLDRINVDYYGVPTPLRQITNITVQDGQTLVLQPYDKGSLPTIEKAILKSDLGVTPNNDGTNIRITFPALTEERRKELVKVIKEIGEKHRVSIRNLRRDTTDILKKVEKSENLSEDEVKKVQDQIQKLTDKYIREIDGLVASKEKEVLAI